MRFAASGRHQWTDAEPYRASRSRERESSQWNRPERAGRGWYAASVRLPGRGARLAASDRSQWTDAKPFREPRSRKSEGYARRCFTSPAHPSSCPCGRNPRRRMRFAASGRHQWTDAEPYRASRSRERESSQWNRPERAGRGWYAASVRLPGRGARLAASDRHWWTDAEPLPCVAQPGKRIIAVEPPGARRARVVRCIRPIARAASTASGRSQWTDAKPFRASRSRGKIRMGAGDTRDGDYVSGTSVQSPVRAESAAAASTACSFRPSSMDGRGAFPCATQSRKE